MFKQAKGFILGFITCVLIFSLVMTATALSTKTATITYNDIKVVIDGKPVTLTDLEGNKIEPILLNSTIYVPMSPMARAFGKTSTYEGSSRTLYIGNTGGKLQYPTMRLNQVVNIGTELMSAKIRTDNYGNTYDDGYYIYYGAWDAHPFQTLLNMKYSRFKCILYIPEGTTSEGSGAMQIEVDGKTVYTSPTMTKTSAPINVDVDITGGNDFRIIQKGDLCINGWEEYGPLIGNAGFYQ